MDNKSKENLTLSGLVYKNQQLEKELIKVQAQLDLMKELFDKYIGG